MASEADPEDDVAGVSNWQELSSLLFTLAQVGMLFLNAGAGHRRSTIKRSAIICPDTITSAGMPANATGPRRAGGPAPRRAPGGHAVQRHPGEQGAQRPESAGACVMHGSSCMLDPAAHRVLVTSSEAPEADGPHACATLWCIQQVVPYGGFVSGFYNRSR